MTRETHDYVVVGENTIPAAFSALFETRWDWNYTTTELEPPHSRAYWPRMRALGDPAYFDDPADLDAMVAGVRRLRETVTTGPLARWMGTGEQAADLLRGRRAATA